MAKGGVKGPNPGSHGKGPPSQSSDWGLPAKSPLGVYRSASFPRIYRKYPNATLVGVGVGVPIIDLTFTSMIGTIYSTAGTVLPGGGIEASAPAPPVLTLSAEAGSYLLEGNNMTPTVHIEMLAAIGTYLLSGGLARLKATTDFSMDGGSYIETVQDAFYKMQLLGSPGSYSLVGNSAIDYISLLISAQTGSYTLLGSQASPRLAIVLTLINGSYTLTGTASSVLALYQLLLDSTSYHLSGNSANTKLTLTMLNGSGSYIIDGTPASIKTISAILADSGSFLVNSQQVTAKLTLVMLDNHGNYIVDGIASALVPVTCDPLILDITAPEITSLEVISHVTSLLMQRAQETGLAIIGNNTLLIVPNDTITSLIIPNMQETNLYVPENESLLVVTPNNTELTVECKI